MSLTVDIELSFHIVTNSTNSTNWEKPTMAALTRLSLRSLVHLNKAKALSPQNYVIGSHSLPNLNHNSPLSAIHYRYRFRSQPQMSLPSRILRGLHLTVGNQHWNKFHVKTLEEEATKAGEPLPAAADPKQSVRHPVAINSSSVSAAHAERF